MSMNMDALPVAVTGAVGSKESLADLLTQAFGDSAGSIQRVSLNYMTPSQQTFDTRPWDPAHAVTTTILHNGQDIQAGNVVTVDPAHFQDVQISVGNNMSSNVFMSVQGADGSWRSFNVTTLEQQLVQPHAADHVPTANDIVLAAQAFTKVAADNHTVAPNDCHNIATEIAASVGATLDPNTGNTANPALNEEGGFWRISYRGTDPGAVDDWQTKVQAGDIVRMARTDGGVHTITVTGGLNADGAHPGQIHVVDNSNGNITEHWQDYDNNTVKGSVTIYRLTTDGTYLTDQSADNQNDTLLGSNFNDLIKSGSGNDTLTGGHGNDTLDGGGGDDTAVFSGKQSDYKITVSGSTATLSDLRAGAPDGTDTIKNIEHVKFADGPVNFADLKNTPAPAPVAGSVTISDASVKEGDNGTTIETFTVTRSGGSAAFDVNFATANGSASAADGDYVAKTGSLHFAEGVNTQTISVVVNGDTKVEANETFNVNLSGATNGATVTDGQGVGTIVNDDVAVLPPPPPPPAVAGAVSISDATVTEGDNGTRLETFTLTRTGGSAAFDVHFATQAGTASAAAGDYVGKSGNVHFAEGVNTQTVSIVVNGDTKVEPTETFKVNLSAATNGATIADGQGIGTIVNDDVAAPPPVAGAISIGDATVTEGDNGTRIETFTVTRTGGSAAFDVHFATQAGSASAADGDYVGKSGNLHFDAGVNTQTISIIVNGDTKIEPTETFKVNLSAATNGATIADGQGIGTIVNDDNAPAAHHAATDFNGDGISDVLFGKNNGQLALWELDGNHVAANVTVPAVPAGWHIDGIGDFGNDGKSDVLLHSDSGKVAMWQMDGNHIASNTTVGSIGADWHVLDVADFNGDGKADVLWENTKGQVAMWEMDGDKIASNTTVGSIGSDWHLVATGDFNGDHKADIVWENSKGAVAMWQMDGDHIAANTTVSSIGSSWHSAGVGDFNGDGKADLLWQNDKGQVAMWQMDGDHVAANTTVGSAQGWNVIGTGDYNHDGKADVLWENAKGQVAEWQMDGDHIAQNLTVSSHSVDWHAV